MTKHMQDAFDASEDTLLISELAELEIGLSIALQFQTDALQTSSWAFNAMASFDAHLEREKHQELIERLEKQSIESDSLKVLADIMVFDLRIKKRKLTAKLKSKAFSQAMQAERDKATAKALENARSFADEAKAQATPQTNVEAAKPKANKQSVKKKVQAQV